MKASRDTRRESEGAGLLGRQQRRSVAGLGEQLSVCLVSDFLVLSGCRTGDAQQAVVLHSRRWVGWVE